MWPPLYDVNDTVLNGLHYRTAFRCSDNEYPFREKAFFSLSFPLIKFELSSNMSVLILPCHIANERHLLFRLFKPKIVERKQFFFL